MNTTRVTLLERIKKEPANESAWAEFDAIYRPMLRLYARDRGLHREDADDLVQQCMVNIHEHIGGFEYDPHKGRFKSWLRTMVNNRWRNDLRKKREVHADTVQLQASVARDETPEETFDRVWAQQHLVHALKLLRDETEPATFLAYHKYGVQKRPGPEVCEELNISQNQLYKIKWRLTRRLAELLKSLEGEE